MPHHPSLEEVLEERSDYEWLEANLSGFFLGDYVDSENEKGDISSPSFSLLSGPSNSEYEVFAYEKATISIERAEESSLQNLKGKSPLGSINFYDSEKTFITLRLSKEIYSNLLTLITNDIKNLSIKIAIPRWENTEEKCLPLVWRKLIPRVFLRL
tara:strand:+ start:12273 stop:12740 length:468 start_codon:yes stop_codon:yes gene_type:complete